MSYVFVGWLIACGGEPTVAPSVPEPAPPEAAVPVEDAEAARAKEAQAAIQALGKDLKGRLIEQMQQGGPAAAVDVCGKEAQARTQRIAETTGIQVGRASSRLRNPKNQGPAWVQEWLEQHGEEGVGDGKPQVFEATANGAKVVRVVKPIPVAAPCLACHGNTEQISADVKAYLADHYAEDQAVGYAVGDLRGVFWAEATL